MREDLKMHHEFLVIAAATTLPKVSKKLALYMVRWRGNLHNLSYSRIRHLLTKVAIGFCHADQDQIAKGLLLEDRHRNHRLGTPILVQKMPN
jgi:hypothetical protein